MTDPALVGPRDVAGAGRMDGGELQTVREFLGLTIESLAGMLRVNPRTIRSWEAGRDPIPARIRDEVALIEAMTAQAVTELVDALRRDPVVAVYRRDEDMHASRPDTAHLPARWWRHVVARAAHEVPGVKIVKHRNKEELIAAAREKGLYPPENATGKHPQWYSDVSRKIDDHWEAAMAAVEGDQIGVFDNENKQYLLTPQFFNDQIAKGGARRR